MSEAFQDPAAKAARTRSSFATFRANDVHAPDRAFAAAMSADAREELSVLDALHVIHVRRQAVIQAHVGVMQDRARETARLLQAARGARMPVEDTAAMGKFLSELNEVSLRTAQLLEETRARTARIDSAVLAARANIEAEQAHFEKERAQADALHAAAEDLSRREAELAVRLDREATERASEAARAARAADRERREREAKAKREAAMRALAEAEEAERHAAAARSPLAEPPPPSSSRNPFSPVPTPSVAHLEPPPSPGPLSPAPAYTSSMAPRTPSPPRAMLPPPPRPTPATVPPPPAPAAALPPRAAAPRSISVVRIPAPPRTNNLAAIEKHISALRVAYKTAATVDEDWARLLEVLAVAAAHNAELAAEGYHQAVDLPVIEPLLRRAEKLNTDANQSAVSAHRFAAEVEASATALGAAAFSRTVATAIAQAFHTVAGSLESHSSSYANVTTQLAPALATFKAAFRPGAKADNVARRTAAAAFWATYRPPSIEVVHVLRAESRAFLDEIKTLESYSAVLRGEVDTPPSSPAATPPTAAPSPAVAAPAPAVDPSETFDDLVHRVPAVAPLTTEVAEYFVRAAQGRARVLETFITLLRDIHAHTSMVPDATIEEVIARIDRVNTELGDLVSRFGAEVEAFRLRIISTVGSVERFDNAVSYFQLLNDVISDRVNVPTEREARLLNSSVFAALRRAHTAYHAWASLTMIERGSHEFAEAADARYWRPFLAESGMSKADAVIAETEAVLANVRAGVESVKEWHAELVQIIPQIAGTRPEPPAKRVQSELVTAALCPACAVRRAESECLSSRTGTWTPVCRDAECVQKVHNGY
jgi:hypothetical protein